MAEIWLICEGTTDLPVLSSVLTRVLSADVVLKAAGGSANVAGVAEYVRHTYAVDVAYVLDRDYRRRAVADATYTDGKRGFMWRRHSIEGYLLAPAVVASAFRSLKSSVEANPAGGLGWIRDLPEEEEAIAAGLRACAEERAPQEADGKDLLGTFLQWLEQAHQARLSRRRLTQMLQEAVPVAYAANRGIYRTDDFLDLANGVRALAGRPAIA